MPTKSDNPFDLDRTIEQRLSNVPSVNGQAGSYIPARAAGEEFELQPQTWELTESAPAKPITTLDRVLEDQQSTAGFQHLTNLNITGSHEVLTRLGPIRFDGSALLCRCPDCYAPMTIRLWLELADCWRCPSSVALDEHVVARIKEAVEQEAKIEAELPAPPPTPAEFFFRSPLDTVAPKFDTGAAAPVREFDSEFSDELDRLTNRSALARFLRRVFRITPAWLVSFLLHSIAMLILAMIVFGDAAGAFDEAITLSTFLDSSDQIGGDIRNENPIDTLADDIAIATKIEGGEVETRNAIQQAAQDALELRVDPQSEMRLPDLSQVKKNITTQAGYEMSFAARDPRVRAEIVEKEGGRVTLAGVGAKR